MENILNTYNNSKKISTLLEVRDYGEVDLQSAAFINNISSFFTSTLSNIKDIVKNTFKETKDIDKYYKLTIKNLDNNKKTINKINGSNFDAIEDIVVPVFPGMGSSYLVSINILESLLDSLLKTSDIMDDIIVYLSKSMNNVDNINLSINNNYSWRKELFDVLNNTKESLGYLIDTKSSLIENKIGTLYNNSKGIALTNDGLINVMKKLETSDVSGFSEKVGKLVDLSEAWIDESKSKNKKYSKNTLATVQEAIGKTSEQVTLLATFLHISNQMTGFHTGTIDLLKDKI